MIKEIYFLDFFSTFLDSISGMYSHLDNVLVKYLLKDKLISYKANYLIISLYFFQSFRMFYVKVYACYESKLNQ